MIYVYIHLTLHLQARSPGSIAPWGVPFKINCVETIMSILNEVFMIRIILFLTLANYPLPKLSMMVGYSRVSILFLELNQFLEPLFPPLFIYIFAPTDAPFKTNFIETIMSISIEVFMIRIFLFLALFHYPTCKTSTISSPLTIFIHLENNQLMLTLTPGFRTFISSSH